MNAARELQPVQTEEQQPRKSRFAFLEGWLYLLPSIILFSVFVFYPMFRTIYLSFFLADQIGPFEFAGLENYHYILRSDSFQSSIKATVLFVLFTVPATIILALFLALLTSEKIMGIGIFRTFFSSTMGMSVAASSVIWMFMYNPSIGVFSKIAEWLGLPVIQWLQNPDYALLAVSLSTIWMSTGFAYLILLGGLQNIDPHLYENARVAGVSYFYQLRRITLPMLSPTLFFIITVSFINAFQTFGQIDILTKGGPVESTNVIVYSIYKDAFINNDVGSASAQAVILFFCVLVLTVLQFKLGEKKVHYR
ncbi:carbohydrate ABC transporter permease [Terribacillus halophilus]|uniref:carbohydrate ABC transporter permease n=1 Tax=Terribacillus halophilus TaxID=361279 RepID=UPI000985A872|nr:sugar ABC transporter permease [Terribacillus halophilus]